MRLPITGIATLSLVLLSGCSAQNKSAGGRVRDGAESVYTTLSPGACKKEVDKSDPNETPYLVCPGVAGYSLIVRRVDAGRRSIDIVDPDQRTHPLHYQQFVTAHMFSLEDKAEWRVASRNGKQVPVALIVPVQAREDDKNPEKITTTYLAVAKIAGGEVCVTDSIPAGSKSDAEIRSAADSAPNRKCAPPRPSITGNGPVAR